MLIAHTREGVEVNGNRIGKSRRFARVCVVVAAILLLLTSCLPPLFNRSPEPRIYVAPGSAYGPPPLEVEFDISGSNDPDGKIVSFTLDFADGSSPVTGTDLSQAITHTYSELGQYLVTLTVVDDDGEEALSMALVSVYVPEEE